MNERRRKSDSIYVRLAVSTLVMLCAYFIYEAHSPVVSSFTIGYKHQTENQLIISGTFNKIRNCKFDSLFITTPMVDSDKVRKVTFEFTDVANIALENRNTRQKGKQYFGPWTLDIDPEMETISMRSLHICNFGLLASTGVLKDYPIR